MKNIIKTVGLLSIFAVIPGAMAATSRVSMISKGTPRLPSIAGYIMANTSTSTGSTVSGTTTYLADVDCVDNYTACIKGNDACGAGFEDCTNSVLLHAKMPTCLNVLSQCSAAGRNSLFGSSDLSAIATSSTKNTDGEVTAYTYPTASSVLGQMITAAQIENQLGTDQCIKKYTTCLRRESICGADFELCTDNKEFKKQAMSCDSTLARCQSAGKTELFGSTTAAAALQPAANSRLADLINEGAALAVNNAVATCNKVTDQCVLNACNKNPNKCITDRPEILIRISDATNGGRAVTTQDLMEISKITDKREVANYIRQECQQTIGSNRYCYMTVKGKPVTKESVLTDPDNVSEVFEDMYSGEFGRFAALNDKINQIVDNFDAKIQEKCIDTMSSCAMRSCGSGIGSVCYKQSRDVTTGSVNITKAGSKSYQEIKSACRAIVDTDPNCQYAAVLSNANLYASAFDDTTSVFTALFPSTDTTGAIDPIGIVATLNASLATSYNDAAIENMRKQCQTTALGCVKSMCGKDYENCYRNRTDIVAGTYDTGNAKLDRSMNKMGGVLDYNIVIGLCMNTVKNASICEEHLKVAAADWRETEYKDSTSWDTGTVRSGWLGSNTTKVKSTNTENILIACAISQQEAESKENCPLGAQNAPVQEGSCDGVMDEDGCLYTEPVYQSRTEYVLENAGKTLFQELLSDVEREAQAKYNAKLTKEQNVCLAQNNGGIRGALDNGSTFMWVKLKGNKIPKNYNMAGLKTKEFTASNELYGSFCRARITVTSDDPYIQEHLGDKATAYFAVGDSFTCGSWIDKATLKKITDSVGAKAREAAGEGGAKEKNGLIWGTIAPALVGGVGGYLGANALQNKGLLGGTSKKDAESKKTALDSCLNNVESARAESDPAKKANFASQALRKAKEGGAEVDGVQPFYTEDVEQDSLSWNYSEKAAVEELMSKTLNATYGNGQKCCNQTCEAKLNAITQLFNSTLESQYDRGPSVRNLFDEAMGSFNSKECSTDYTEITKKIPELKLTTVKNGTTKSKSIRNIDADLNTIYTACMNAKSSDTGKKKNNVWTNVGGAAVGSVVAGALGFGITKSVQQAKYDSAANDAVAEWMKEIGEHIQCYLGTEELGSYGDVISFTVE